MQTLRLHVWGSNPTLPTLDPTSLYAASLLLATFAANESVQLQLTSASTALTSRVPLLQVIETAPQSSSTGAPSATTTELLDDIDAIRAFCVAAGLDADLAGAPEKAARVLALHAMLDDQMLDLTLHSLFSFPANYRAVTAPSYSSTGSATPEQASTSFHIPFTGSSIPSRLRNAVQQRLTAVGIWGVGGTESAAQAQEAHDLANRAGLTASTKSKLSFGPAAKDAVKDEFEKTKLAHKLNDLLAVLESCDLLSGDATSSLDAHVFAVLAPHLYSTPALPVQLLTRATLSTFPKLSARLDVLRDRLWPADRSTWPSWASAQDVAASPAALSTSDTPASSSWWPFSTSTTQAQQAAEKASTRPHARSTRPRSSTPEDARLRWGRLLWITSAVVGLVGYTFASGIVSVQWVEAADDTDDQAPAPEWETPDADDPEDEDEIDDELDDDDDDD